MNILKISVISLLWILVMGVKTTAQSPIYKNLNVDQGLVSSEVYDCYQDKEGHIWFATDKGLSRYNGYEFDNFDVSDGLTGNVVLRFYPQLNGQIWCYSFHDKSLFYFNEEFDGFHAYKYNELLGSIMKNKDVVKSVYLDSLENLHIGGPNIDGELVIGRNGKANFKYFKDIDSLSLDQRFLVVKNTVDSSLSSPFFCVRCTDLIREDYLYEDMLSTDLFVKWLVPNEKAVFMNGEQTIIKENNDERVILDEEYHPIVIEIIDSTRFLIGYEFGGAKVYDDTGTEIDCLLYGESVSSFLIDHDGGYWFTTLESGVFYVKNPAISMYNFPETKSPFISSLVKTNDDELIIGFKNGSIIKLLEDKKSIVIDTPQITYQAMVENDPSLGYEYLVNASGIKINSRINTSCAKNIIKLSEPVNNTMFLSSSGAFYKVGMGLDSVEYEVPYRIHDVCLWQNDTLISTAHGVFKYANDSTFSMSYLSELFQYRSEDIDVDYGSGVLYVATEGAGLIVYDDHQIINLTQEDGLNSNIIQEVLIENDSVIWLCTNGGINRIHFNKDTTIVTGIDKNKGLISNEVLDIEIIRDTVWVGTQKGLCSFPKNLLINPETELSYLSLKEVLVNDVKQSDMKYLHLAYKKDKVDIVLEGISFLHNESLNYIYRLNDEQIWTFTQDNVIHFSSLSPGQYHFEAKVCADQHNCSEKTVTYSFIVLAPIWKRWWFVLLCLLALGNLIFWFFKIRVLTYNRDIVRELMRLFVQKLKRKEMYFSFKENGNEVRIQTKNILYVKSAGNYIDVHTKDRVHTIRLNIGKFLDNVPDRLEYIRLHRSYIVRIDKITLKSKNEVELISGQKVPVSLNRNKKLKEVVF